MLSINITQRYMAVLIGLISLTACQTTGLDTSSLQGTANNTVSKSNYTLFYDQKDHLVDLTNTGNLSDASILYEEQRAFFDQKALEDKELSNLLNQVASGLNSTHEKQIQSSLKQIQTTSWPINASSWGNIRTIVDTAQNTVTSIPISGIYVNPIYRPNDILVLEKKLSVLKSKISETSLNDFSNFDHHAGINLFSIHPGIRDAKIFFEQHPNKLNALLSKSTSSQIKKYAMTVGQDSLSEAQWNQIGASYMEARIQELPAKRRSLKDILSIITDAKEADFELDKIDSVSINFVEVTSRTLLKQGQIDFPAKVDVDLPFNIAKSELDTAFLSENMKTADYLIVFDVALAKARRKVKRMINKRSEVVVGFRQEANPKYQQLQNRVTMAQMAAQNANMNLSMRQNQYCSGLDCIAVAIAVNNARKKRDLAQSEFQGIMQQLNSTSPMVDVPVKRPYNYQVGEIDAEKTMTVHYYIIDIAQKKYLKSTFDIAENKRFGVAYSVASEDPNRESHINQHDTEEDVTEWEQSPSSVKLSQLISHYTEHSGKSKRLKSITALQSEMLKDRNTAIANFKENTFEESTVNDPRFDSVVAIYVPSGSLGTGFFVRPDIVMTNYHVVDEGNFVELKMHDEQETFGKVIARDAGLDLALIKVQSRGKPVAFYQNNRIELGSTVEVIGHPKGYEFSITRGVVSAVRQEKSPVLNAGNDILQIQIDAATSPGNSGGPVFMGDKVISIVSWGRIDRGSENLNFTVHHSEAERFLAEALAGS